MSLSSDAGWSHVLVVGGTGMLAEVSVALAGRASVLTSVARTPESLRSLDERLEGLACAHHRVPIDYRDAERFSRSVGEAIAGRGAIDLAVGWFHDEWGEAPLALARRLADQRSRSAFFHVLGSAAASPTASLPDLRGRLEIGPPSSYHQVVLGFVSRGGRSRWLTHREIGQGVLQAIAGGAEQFFVGQVRPWSSRP